MKLLSILGLSIFMLTSFFTQAQDYPKDPIYTGKTTYFATYAGMPSTLVSLQFDRIFLTQRKHYLSYAAGIGVGHPQHLFDEKRFSIPASINYSSGLYSNHHFEMGGGLTYLYSTHKSGILIGFKFGYKYQNKNLYFRVSSAPSGYLISFHKDIIDGTEYKNTDLNNNLLGLSVGFALD